MGQLRKAGNVDCSTQPEEFDRLQCVLSKLLSLFLCLFWVVWLSISQQVLLYACCGRALVYLVSFRDF